MEDLDILLFDEKENKIIELEEKKSRRKKIMFRRKVFSILFIIFASIAYFSSNISKVKSLDVTGNQYFMKQDILDLAGLSYESRYAVLPAFYLQYKLEQSPLIEKATIHKTWDGSIQIEVVEKTIVGYYIGEDKKTYIVLGHPFQSIEVDNAHQKTMIHYPLLAKFDQENLEKLANAFTQTNNEIPQSYISLISEMVPYQRSYDKNMVKMVMQDGNIIYSSYEAIPLLKEYKKVIQGIKEKNICLELDFANDSILSTNCN